MNGFYANFRLPDPPDCMKGHPLNRDEGEKPDPDEECNCDVDCVTTPRSLFVCGCRCHWSK